MKKSPHQFLLHLLAAGMTLAAAQAPAQPYPSKTVRIIMPFPVGGPADAIVRPVAAKLSENLKVQFIIDSRPGANGAIGSVLAVKSPPDGYTLLNGTSSSLSMHAAINPKLPFDPVKDLAAITAIGFATQILVVHPSVPATNVKQLTALAKARPGEMIYASTGVGSAPHFSMELLNNMTGVKMIHVPYKGGAPATIDLLAGQIMVYFGSMQTAIDHVRTGRLRALGVASLKRSQAAPEIPTIAESGLPGYEVGNVYGLFAPAGTPREILGRVQTEIVKVLAQPEVRNLMVSAGTDIVGNTPEEFAAWLRADMVKWANVARSAGIKGE